MNSPAPVATPAEHAVRAGNRRKLTVAGRLTWRDANGMLRFASVVTRDVSETDVFVECQGPASIPKFRLVHFQVERSAQNRPAAAPPTAAWQGPMRPPRRPNVERTCGMNGHRQASERRRCRARSRSGRGVPVQPLCPAGPWNRRCH